MKSLYCEQAESMVVLNSTHEKPVYFLASDSKCFLGAMCPIKKKLSVGGKERKISVDLLPLQFVLLIRSCNAHLVIICRHRSVLIPQSLQGTPETQIKYEKSKNVIA